MIVDLQTTGTKEALALMQGLKKIVEVVDAQLKDGFQVSEDVPPILSVALQELIPLVAAVSGVSEEAKAHPMEFGRSILVGGSEIAELFVK